MTSTRSTLLAIAGLLFAASTAAPASAEPRDAARASFPLLTNTEQAAELRPTTLPSADTSARAALPPPPAPAPPSTAAPGATPPTSAPRVSRAATTWHAPSMRGDATTTWHAPAPWSRGDAGPPGAGKQRGAASTRDPVLDRGPTPPTTSEAWLLSVEGVTHAPVDVGFQALLETPIGLRFSGGYGWVPSAYRSVLTAAAVAATGDTTTQSILENGLESGTAWRAQVGIRPLRKLGLYLDAGYSRMKLGGSLSTSDFVDSAALGVNDARYTLDSTLQLGSLELGYQAVVASRVVMALGVGVTKVLSAETTVSAEGGAAQDPALAAASAVVDEQLPKYGVVPTLTLRLGLDLI